MTCRSLVALTLLALSGLGSGANGAPLALDVEVARYRLPVGSGAVVGRALEERRRPDRPDLPLHDTVVTLVPRSEAFLRRLEELRARSRDSIRAYRDATGAMRREREAYERTLWEAGAADLVRATQVDGDGVFAFDDVPAGEWLLFGWRSVFVDLPSVRVGKRDRSTFTGRERLDGYSTVTVWLRQISVRSGARELVELTDRNAWFSGVLESLAPGAGR